MADFDIDPLGDHESRLEEPGVKIFLSPPEEDQLGNQNVNKKRHWEEKVKELDT